MAEILSMHGCGESDRAPRNYLHTMGPRDAQSMAYHGLNQGHVFGFIGSTDHHSAHPGSHGYGRMAVWATELTREGIWDAILNRRTYAITGDKIELRSAVNGVPMGSIAPAHPERRVRGSINARDRIDLVEVVRNGDVIWSGTGPGRGPHGHFTGLVGLSVGWGQAGTTTDWDVELEIENGALTEVEPRLRGVDIVDPLSTPPSAYAFSAWERTGANSVRLRTRTVANPTVMTDATQQLVLRISGTDRTVVRAGINGVRMACTVGELRAGPRSGYTAEFVSPAFQFHRAVADSERQLEVDVEDVRESSTRDWYHVRVRQTNDQWALGTPTWVAP